MPARKSAKKPAKKKSAARKKAATASPPGSAKSEGAAESDVEAEPAKPGAVTAKDVNLGHVFALRPRVRTSFRQPDFLRARELLEDEHYESTSEAARAVALKALELTHDGPQGGRGKKKRGL